MRLRVNQPRIDRHCSYVNYFGVAGNGGGGSSHGGYFAVFHDHHTVFNHPMRDGEQLATLQDDRFSSGRRGRGGFGFCGLLGDGCRYQRKQDNDFLQHDYWPSL